MDFIKKAMKQILPHNVYLLLRNVHSFFVNQKEAKDVDLLSFQRNEKIFEELGFSKSAIKKTLRDQGLSYSNGDLSWHYHIFAGWHDLRLRKSIDVKNILEIGTHNGSFTKFLSKVFKDARIFTIDLPQHDWQFVHTYNRETLQKQQEFLSIRRKNLKGSNIKFIELNSINILKYFKNMKFDAIWVDGDHHNPQVTIDLINCTQLIKKDGILCNDDVIDDLNHKKDNYVSNESFITLNHLENNKLLKNYFVTKRTRNHGRKSQKYVSVSTLI